MIDDPRFADVDLAALVDGGLSGEAWDAWASAHPEAAAEVLLARRVRAIIAELQAASIDVPAGFEARLMARVRGDQTILDLLDLALDGTHRALLEILTALMQLFPRQPAPAR